MSTPRDYPRRKIRIRCKSSEYLPGFRVPPAAAPRAQCSLWMSAIRLSSSSRTLELRGRVILRQRPGKPGHSGVGAEASPQILAVVDHVQRPDVRPQRGDLEQEVAQRELVNARYAATAASSENPSSTRPERNVCTQRRSRSGGQPRRLRRTRRHQREHFQVSQGDPPHTVGEALQEVLPTVSGCVDDVRIAPHLVDDVLHDRVNRFCGRARSGTRPSPRHPAVHPAGASTAPPARSRRCRPQPWQRSEYGQRPPLRRRGVPLDDIGVRVQGLLRPRAAPRRVLDCTFLATVHLPSHPTHPPGPAHMAVGSRVGPPSRKHGTGVGGRADLEPGSAGARITLADRADAPVQQSTGGGFALTGRPSGPDFAVPLSRRTLRSDVDMVFSSRRLANRPSGRMTSRPERSYPPGRPARWIPRSGEQGPG